MTLKKQKNTTTLNNFFDWESTPQRYSLYWTTMQGKVQNCNQFFLSIDKSDDWILFSKHKVGLFVLAKGDWCDYSNNSRMADLQINQHQILFILTPQFNVNKNQSTIYKSTHCLERCCWPTWQWNMLQYGQLELVLGSTEKGGGTRPRIAPSVHDCIL